MKKKNIVLIIILFLLVGFLGVYGFIKINKVEKPKEDPVASIIHRELIGLDAGYEYFYSIYRKGNKYFYIKEAIENTIAGAKDYGKPSKGIINNKSKHLL